jgi:tetratricopeptide (TPR) repeat protein/predicted DNA-binding WGR domain protein
MRQHLTYLDNESYLFWEIAVTGCSFRITSGKVGTVGLTSINICQGEKECFTRVDRLIEQKKSEGYFATHEGYITKYELPDALKKFLFQKRTVKIGDKIFGLAPSYEIKLISVVIDHHWQSSTAWPALVGNPYKEQQGFFCTTAYSLVSKSPDENDTEGLLIWLPLLELFGTWDRVHRQLYLYPDASWIEIEENLPNYLQRKINSDRFTNVLAREKVLDYFDFIPRDIPGKIKDILLRSAVLKIEDAEEFLELYEPRLLRHPWCSELEETYKALVVLYHRIGQVYEREAEYFKAIEWLERSLLVVNQSSHFRSKVFIDIFIQLSFCYFETSRFEASLRYMKMYQVYDATAWDTCEQIKESICRVQQLYADAMASCQRAIEQRSAECYEEAIRITHEAVKKAPNDPLLHFNLACFYSLSYKTKEALYHLEEAIKKGYDNPMKIIHDGDLENIRSTKEFKDIRQRYF